MAEFCLPSGETVLIDEADLELATSYSWRARRGSRGMVYVVAGRDTNIVWLHRLIAGDRPFRFVDHANGNGLDNRRCNLRHATPQESVRNRRGWSTRSPFKGVEHHRRKWRAGIRVNGNQIRLGSFVTPEEAARAYDRAAVEHFGAFARLNFP